MYSLLESLIQGKVYLFWNKFIQNLIKNKTSVLTILTLQFEYILQLYFLFPVEYFSERNIWTNGEVIHNFFIKF